MKLYSCHEAWMLVDNFASLRIITERFTSLPLEQRAEMAPKAAVEELIVEHARQGLPIYIWRDGRVVEVPPDQ